MKLKRTESDGESFHCESIVSSNNSLQVKSAAKRSNSGASVAGRRLSGGIPTLRASLPGTSPSGEWEKDKERRSLSGEREKDRKKGGSKKKDTPKGEGENLELSCFPDDVGKMIDFVVLLYSSGKAHEYEQIRNFLAAFSNFDIDMTALFDEFVMRYNKASGPLLNRVPSFSPSTSPSPSPSSVSPLSISSRRKLQREKSWKSKDKDKLTIATTSDPNPPSHSFSFGPTASPSASSSPLHSSPFSSSSSSSSSSFSTSPLPPSRSISPSLPRASTPPHFLTSPVGSPPLFSRSSPPHLPCTPPLTPPPLDDNSPPPAPRSPSFKPISPPPRSPKPVSPVPPASPISPVSPSNSFKTLSQSTFLPSLVNLSQPRPVTPPNLEREALQFFLKNWLFQSGSLYKRQCPQFFRTVASFLSETKDPAMNELKLLLLKSKSDSELDSALPFYQAINYAKDRPLVKKGFKGALETYLFSHYTIPELAEGITFVMFRVYSSIGPSELHDGSWQGDERMVCAPHVHALGILFNRISFLCVCEVLGARSHETRVENLAKCAELAKTLKKMKNFEGMSAVTSIFSMAAIQRLKSLWAALDSKTQKLIKKLEVTFHPQKNYKKYSELLDRAQPPLLPWLAPKLRELRFMYDGNQKTKVDGRLCNDYLQMVGTSVNKYLQFKRPEYSLPVPKKHLVHVLETVSNMDPDYVEDCFYDHSSKLLKDQNQK